MPCPKCNKPKSPEEDHRFCVIDLLHEKVITSYADWCRLCEVKPETKILGKKKIKLPKKTE
jgi:hypothetical protein